METRVYRVSVVVWVESPNEDSARRAVDDMIENRDSSDIFPNFVIESVTEYDYPGPPELEASFRVQSPGEAS